MPNLKRLLIDNIYPVIFVVIVLIFFYPFVVFGKIPIPADTIVGMYYPFRDTVWAGYTAGVPFKNFLITDPVRQQYVWRKIAIEELKKGKLPLWNPYSFSGTPLLANFQTAAFYPLNILFFILPFDLTWGILIMLQPLLAGLFLYSYLRFMNVGKMGSFLGSIVFSFSGFTIAWLEWNTILHVMAWLPLSLLAIEKIIQLLCHSERSRGISELVSAYSRIRERSLHSPPSGGSVGMTIVWSIVFLFSLVSSFFAGHLQIFFYSLLIIIIYTIVKIFSLESHKSKAILLFVICYLLFVIITSIQWLPTLQFILNSARDFDQGSWMKEGWFLPWQNLIQFIVPDFFGNPATGNYWGIWNYGEFIGYIGLIPLIFVLYGIIFARDKKTLFWVLVGFLALIFALPTTLAKLPYQWQIPFISTSQPTRLMVIVDFSLSILAALGFDWFLKNLKNRNSQKKLVGITLLFSLIFLIIWLFVLNPSWMQSVLPDNLLIAKRNLILPTILFILGSGSLMAFIIVKNNNLKLFFILCSLLFVAFDLFRFGWKFTPFTRQDWIFPQTKLIKIISDGKDYGRFMVLDRKILPPNFSTAYKMQDVSGYDPLYLKDYGQLVASWDRDRPDISPAAFNRIITPSNYESFITDLLGVKYIMSLTPLQSLKLEYLSQEGDTYLYANKKVFPRVFLAENAVKANNKQEIINKMFELGDNLRNTVVVVDSINIAFNKLQDDETAEIISYIPNKVIIQVKTNSSRILVLTDTYYPLWKAFINGQPTKIHQVNFSLRGIIVPKGNHAVEFII